MRAPGAILVSAKVDGLAAEGAAVVDEGLEFLECHFGWECLRLLRPCVCGSCGETATKPEMTVVNDEVG